jgi:septal ring factor EnvC (AmiA/AmiB activator)
MRKILLPFIICLCIGTVAHAQPGQERGDLEKERQQIQKELKEIQSMYDQIKAKKKQSIGQLTILNRKIALQEQYLNNINREIRAIDDDIYLANLEIYRLTRQVDTLKQQYARTIVYAYKNRSNYDYLNFIFSASSFNDAIRRVSYLKNYRAYRAKQMKVILQTQDQIAKRKQQQLGRKEQKSVALTNQVKEVQVLAIQKKEKDAVVNELKSKEKELAKQIATKKKRDRDVQNAINAIVRREVEAAKKAAALKAKEDAEKNVKVTTTVVNPDKTNVGGTTTTRRTDPVAKPESYLNLNAVDVALNSNFQANKLRLPWPVDNGLVTVRYGNQKVENTNLTFDSPGITIATPNPGMPVKAIFEGEVSAVYAVGDAMAITIRHGRYFTTYVNLTGVTVTRGSQVKTNQVIGRSGSNEDGDGGQIDFILMMESRNLDPQQWLRR